jgi:hypothetical protein
LSRRTIAIALGVVVVAAAGITAATAYFDSRDDATLEINSGPGTIRPRDARPVVSAGNVLLLYREAAQAPRLRDLAHELGGAGAALKAAGQAVLVRRDARLRAPVRALSARHRLDAAQSGDRALRDFAERWLGRIPG